jgi:hypothetical protein
VSVVFPGIWRQFQCQHFQIVVLFLLTEHQFGRGAWVLVPSGERNPGRDT